MQTYNAASTFATTMSSVLEREELFMDYNKKNEHVNDELNKTTDKHAEGDGKEKADEEQANANDEDNDNDDSGKCPLTKKRKVDMSKYFKTTVEESDNNDEYVLREKDEEEEEED
jgi:hypothetical protein